MKRSRPDVDDESTENMSGSEVPSELESGDEEQLEVHSDDFEEEELGSSDDDNIVGAVSDEEEEEQIERSEAEISEPEEEEEEDEERPKEWTFDNLPHDRTVLLELIKKLVSQTAKGANKGARAVPRKELISHLVASLVKYYGYNENLAKYLIDFFGPVKAVEFMEANEQPNAMTIRCNTLKSRRRELAQTLIDRGCNVDVIGDWSKHGLKVVESTVPVGATPEYLAGHYMIQSASSFLPVIALGPKPGETILDMAAAPGGKSCYIGQMMRNTGVLVSNDYNRERTWALTANLHRLGVRNAVVTNLDGRKMTQHFPEGTFNRVLLDAPCAGLGVIFKDKRVKLRRTVGDFNNAANMQKALLLQAIDLVDPKDCNNGGSVIVYSTCSLSVEENESVIAYALRRRHVKLVPINDEIPFGVPGMTRYRQHRFTDRMALCKRVYPHEHAMDGFFVAKLVKTKNGEVSCNDE